MPGVSSAGGHQGWHVDSVAVQGYNIRHAGLITFGECWHGNHHAFPESAKMGVEHGQMDPGWWLISILSYLGLAREIKLPGSVPPRKGLRRIKPRHADQPAHDAAASTGLSA